MQKPLSDLHRRTLATRRKKVLRSLEGGVAILKGAPPPIRSHDTEYAYRQDSDFLYLTGYTAPGAACILNPNSSKPFTLFVMPKDPEKEVWTGRRLSFEETKALFDADEVLDIAVFEEAAYQAMKGARRVFIPFNHDQAFRHTMVDMLHRVQQELHRVGEPPQGLDPLGAIVHEIRLLKDEFELECMRKAARISAEAHTLAMEAARPGMYEYELEALIDYHFRRSGATGPSYLTIVAAGANATVLHYVHNRDRLQSGQLVLIDAGAEVEGYAADITRTFPVDTKFGSSARALYEVVLRAQKEVLEAARPGVTFEELHELDVRLLCEGLIELGLLEEKLETAIESGSYKKYFMHRTGHWLGLDVHDVGNYRCDGQSRKLQPGMVFTVEPGLYINEEAAVPDEFRGLGIRIEDDVHITDNGAEILTLGTPKEIKEIEQLREKGFSV